MKIITKENIKKGDLIQYCGFSIFKSKELIDAGFEPEFYFVEEESGE